MSQEHLLPEGLKPQHILCYERFAGPGCNDPKCPFVHDVERLQMAPTVARHVEFCALHDVRRCPLPEKRCNFSHSPVTRQNAVRRSRQILLAAKRNAPPTEGSSTVPNCADQKRLPAEIEQAALCVILQNGGTTLSTFPVLFADKAGYPFAYRKWKFERISDVFELWRAEEKVVFISDGVHQRIKLTGQEAERLRIKLEAETDVLRGDNRTGLELPINAQEEDSANRIEKGLCEKKCTTELLQSCDASPERPLLPAQSNVEIYNPQAAKAAGSRSKRQTDWKRNQMVCICGAVVRSRCAMLRCGCLYCRRCVVPLVRSRCVDCIKCKRRVKFGEDLCEAVTLISDFHRSQVVRDTAGNISNWPVSCLMIGCRWAREPRDNWNRHAAVCNLIKRYSLPLDFGRGIHPGQDFNINGKPETRLDLADGINLDRQEFDDRKAHELANALDLARRDFRLTVKEGRRNRTSETKRRCEKTTKKTDKKRDSSCSCSSTSNETSSGSSRRSSSRSGSSRRSSSRSGSSRLSSSRSSSSRSSNSRSTSSRSSSRSQQLPEQLPEQQCPQKKS